MLCFSKPSLSVKTVHDSTRQRIRRHCQQARRALTPTARENASRQVCEQIHALNVYQQAKHIAFYHAIDGEIDLRSLWAQAEIEEKQCYMPRVHTNHTLSFLPATPSTPCQINRFNIQEPDVPLHRRIQPNHLDLILIPLLAFDDHGTRLGHGAGYYDRTLTHDRPPCLLGVAYAFQHQAFIHPAPWDVPLTGVVTENQVHWSTR